MTRSIGTTRGAKGQAGAVLITAVLALAAMTILMFAMTSLRVSEIRAISSNVQVTQAQLTAEAGIEAVRGIIAATNAIPLGTVSGTTGGHVYSAEVRLVGTDLFVESTGVVNDKQVTVEARLDVSEANRILEEYAILACHDLTITGSADVVNGDVYSGGTLTIDKTGGLVNGDARAYGDVVLGKTSAVSGNAISKTGVVRGAGPSTPGKKLVDGYAAFPAHRPYPAYTVTESEVRSRDIRHDPDSYDIPDYCEDGTYRELVQIQPEEFAAWEAEAIAAGTHLPANTLPFPVVPGATYYIDGDLTISGDVAADATFIIEGDLTINGGARITSPGGGLALVVQGNVSKGNGNASIEGVLYANGTIELGNGTLDILGSLVLAEQTGSSSLSGNLNVTYRRASDSAELPKVQIVGAEISRWRLISN